MAFVLGSVVLLAGLLVGLLVSFTGGGTTRADIIAWYSRYGREDTTQVALAMVDMRDAVDADSMSSLRSACTALTSATTSALDHPMPPGDLAQPYESEMRHWQRVASECRLVLTGNGAPDRMLAEMTAANADGDRVNTVLRRYGWNRMSDIGDSGVEPTPPTSGQSA